jgi:hypothetical protein
MARTVNKSALTGRFVSDRTAARNPGGTVRQTVGGRASGYRSASTGRFVSARHSQATPWAHYQGVGGETAGLRSVRTRSPWT